jgi:hypothetical protein
VSYSEVIRLTLSESVNYLDTTGISDFIIVFFLILEYCDIILSHFYAAGNRSELNSMLNFPCLEFFVLLPNGFHISAYVARIPWKVKSFILGVAYLFTCTLLISTFHFFVHECSAQYSESPFKLGVTLEIFLFRNQEFWEIFLLSTMLCKSLHGPQSFHDWNLKSSLALSMCRLRVVLLINDLLFWLYKCVFMRSTYD